MASFQVNSIRSVFVLIVFIQLVSTCVLLLNGWTPVSVKERTQLAEVVLSGTVIRAFKDVRTSAKTYSAEIEVSQIYKGADLLPKLTDKPLFTVRNFGDKPACYADVHEGDIYIFFLTLFDEQLSAKYDDIFGAIADFTATNEEEVLTAQGWDTWSSWSPCTSKCGGGEITRQRPCHQETCEGEPSQKLTCNSFSCHGVKNVLETVGVDTLPSGVRRVRGRDGAYRISSEARLNSPTKSLFSRSFPTNFAILISVKLSEDFSGYIFTVSDNEEKPRVGVYYGEGEWRFGYIDQHGLPGKASPVFSGFNSADGNWHQIAFQIHEQNITMFYDCEKKTSKSLLRTRWPQIPINSIMAIGPYYTKNGASFEGEVEQLVISDNPNVAALQCGEKGTNTNVGVEMQDSREMDTKTTTRPDKNNRRVSFEWSEWSACSVSCGRGLQSRTLYCTNNQADPSACIPHHIPRFQARRCHLQHCSGSCRLPCMNGGVCDQYGRCLCEEGYNGEQCEKAVCDPPCRHGGYCISPGQCSCPYGFLEPDCTPFCQLQCLNGGSCVGPDVCQCPSGFTGPRCEKAVCELECKNGGQCIGANKCACRHGYTGVTCQQPVCNPPCENGGVCEKPYQCSCRAGTIGWFCEYFTCSKQCKNGGVCVGPNKCSCSAGFRGSRCQKRACRGGCLNGGRCVRKRKCECPLGFRGKRCQKRKCRLEGRLEPFVKTYQKSVSEKYLTRCGPWSICVKTRLRHVMMAREVFKPVFRCV